MKTCRLCRSHVVSSLEHHHTYIVTCPICGHYRINYLCLDLPITVSSYILSGVTRNHWESFGKEFEIVSDSISSLDTLHKSSPIPIPATNDIPTKAEFVLKHIRRKSEFPGSIVDIDPAKDYSLGYCKNTDEFKYLLKYLLSFNYVINVPLPGVPAAIINKYQLTPSGWAYLAGIGVEAKDQGFIAMAFGLPTSDDLHKNGIRPGIESAGYKPLRIDSKEHINKIDDEIVAEIRKSRFVVADLTGKNAGAYFEAGFAQGLGKPVIWTCQQSEIDAGNVHFDTRQYSIVSWEPDKLDDFAKRLTQRIESTPLGHGMYVNENCET